MLPLESSYGDLSQNPNWRQLVEDTCCLVDRNPVQWTEVYPLDRDEVQRRCRERSTIAIFGAVMDMYAEAYGATMWVCKSMQYSAFVDALEGYFTDPCYIYLGRGVRVDPTLAVTMLFLVGVGVFAGRWLKDFIPEKHLKRSFAFFLIGIGTWVILRP